MFAKPEWFDLQGKIWLRPKSVAGYRYYWVVAGVGVTVLLALLLQAKYPEALIWLLLVNLGWIWDLRHTKSAARQKEHLEKLLYIGDEPEKKVSTERFELYIKE